MAEEASTGDTTTTTDDAAASGASKTFTQDQVNDLIAREKGKFQSKYGDYDDLKAAKARLDELEQAGRSELEKATGERDKLKGDLTTTQAEALRLRVALEKELPVEFIDRLKGSSKEEIEADADVLLKLVGGGTATTSFDGGARESATAANSMDSLIRRSAGRS